MRHHIRAGLAVFTLITFVLILQSFQPSRADSGDALAATYSRGSLRVTIPYRAPHAGAGQLRVEILDPEDHVLARSERRVETVGGKGSWQDDLKLVKALAVDDLVWHRVRYRFAFDGKPGDVIEGAESISEILRMPVLHIIGQKKYLAGGQAGVRVVVTDSKNAAIREPGTVRIDLESPGAPPRTLFHGRLNQRGTAEAQFRMPDGLVGHHTLRYVADTPIGSAEYSQQVQVEDQTGIMLTTEKPIYQPGQTIHVRALALNRAHHEASAGRALTFELEDSRGNKVWKTRTQTDQFGIASAEFTLADEVNLGAYHLRALMEPNRAELTLKVERYVLPKFKVAIDFGEAGKPAPRGYRPGDRVTGTVRANYFFGKPVTGGAITVKATGMDVALVDAGSVQGVADADGAYRFDLRLPDYFAGKPLSQGAARVLIEATVKDSTGHAEARGEPITVSQSPLLITAIPEGGTLIPGIENQVFIVTSYPDGKPAHADIKVRTPAAFEQSLRTDTSGVAVMRMTPGAEAGSAEIEAVDREGNRASTTARFEMRSGADQILLRLAHAVYKPGDRVALKLYSSTRRGSAYVDVIKSGQTILTRDVEIVNGQAELAFTATAEMAGTLDCNVYIFGRNAQPVADHRLIFVQPADELRVTAEVDRPVHVPGEEAHIRFRVTNSRGEGVQAALGLQVVDEAVFALAEKQPGFAKVFFYLEQSALKPRYEIHSLSMTDVVGSQEDARAGQRDRAARALFAATETVRDNRFEMEIGRIVPRTKFQEYWLRFAARFTGQMQDLAARLNGIYAAKPDAGDLAKMTAAMNLSDPWGTRIRFRSWGWGHYYAASAGPDKRFGTGDDMTQHLQVRTRETGNPTSDGVNLRIEHERGPFNGLVEIVGIVTDPTGAVIPAASIKLREIATAKERTVRSNAMGEFTLAGIPAGRYRIEIAAPGFRSSMRELSLAVRDRASLSAALSVGDVTEVVSVNGMPAGIGGVPGGVAGGIPGGIAGGAIGGIIGAVPAAAPPPPPVRAEMPLARLQPVATMTTVVDRAATMETKTGPSAPRVRSYFPEALYINPRIITDASGAASISIPLADSITTWRIAMMASTQRGALGSGTASIKVFQDFFVDLDLPVTLTQGDRVSIPVAAHNYSGSRGDVSLELKADDWFTLVDDTADKSVTVDSGRAGGTQFTIQANRIGKFKLTLAARMAGGAGRADIVIREIEVVPNGREENVVHNGRLETAVRHEISFPDGAIHEAAKLFVRLYPGPLSQVIEGMDSILQMPHGCFEQTSSSTYPNVLALDYMRRTKKATPEIRAKAEGYIANGYQRLLTFEVPGGGFSWFGSAPANKILTSYGLMEFSDMAKVYEVDQNVIRRTQQWLASQQQADGSWKPDTGFINEGVTNRYTSDAVRITAYIAWSLANTGYTGPAVAQARQFIATRRDRSGTAASDAYTLAVIANFAADYGRDREFIRRSIEHLLSARIEKDEQVWWTSEETAVYGRGASAAVETTGLAVQALLKSGEASGTASKALRYLASKKDAAGNWGSTQATIMALRAIVLSTEKGAADVRGNVEVTVNGKPAGKLVLTAENNDLLHQFVVKAADLEQANAVDLRFDGKGGLAYQVVGRYFVPWNKRPGKEPLSIDVTYDRSRLPQDDIATATVTVRNNLSRKANMVMIDLGIPPGFDLLTEDLASYQEESAGRKTDRLEKFSMTATQAILYFDSIGAGEAVMLRYRLRAKYPIRTRTFQSRAYEYYDPAVKAVARPIEMEIQKK